MIKRNLDNNNDNIMDTHREKAPSNKTPALTKSMNTDIWVVDTLDQLFIRGSYTEKNFQKNKGVSGKTPFFVKGQFCTTHFICHVKTYLIS